MFYVSAGMNSLSFRFRHYIVVVSIVVSTRDYDLDTLCYDLVTVRKVTTVYSRCASPNTLVPLMKAETLTALRDCQQCKSRLVVPFYDGWAYT